MSKRTLSDPMISRSDYEQLPYFHKGCFKNSEGTYKLTPWDVLVWQVGNLFKGNRVKWPDWVPSTVPEPEVVERSIEPRITFINHVTFLIQVDNLNIITDPVFCKRTSPVQWLGPSRRTPAGLTKEQLPPIDYVLLSHNHYDHVDLDALRFLKQRNGSQIIGGLGIGRKFPELAIYELAWWEEMELNGCEVAFTSCHALGHLAVVQ